ncbi:MAG: hypothetical protein IK093_01575, partial [Ruminiclostridium sp.]|nr:hypothetical protein [Ruminiclostridium sp.]
MKNYIFRRAAVITVTALVLLSSCKSIETTNITSAPETSVSTTEPVRNEDFGGIMLDTAGRTAAAPISAPESREVVTNTTIDPSEPLPQEDFTTTSSTTSGADETTVLPETTESTTNP